MRELRVRRFLFFTIALVAVTSFTNAVAFATCGEGEKNVTALELTPDKWDGVFEQEKTFTIKNVGTLEITALIVSLISPKNGLKVTHELCGKTLAAGASCIVKVKCLKQDEATLSAIQYTPMAIDTSVLQCLVF